MCISYSASINSFFINLLSSICLILYGNSNLKTYNLIFGLFSIYTSLMQLVDLGIWGDLKCNIGTNKIASLLGPVLVYIQPLMIFIIAYFVINNTDIGKTLKRKVNILESSYSIFKNFSISTSNFNLSKIINIIYGIVIILVLYKYYTNTDIDITCSQLINGTIKWKWFPMIHHLGFLYFSVLVINFISINPTSSYIYTIMVVYSILLIISYTWNKTHLGEIWCYTSNSLPLLLLIIQKIFRNYLY
jgi:hypothetical protein